MKKLLGLLTLAICSFGLVVGVKADEYPTVTDATKPDSIASSTVTIDDSTEGVVIATVDSGEWHLIDNTMELTRPVGYTWVGLNFAMPSGAKDIKIGETSYGNAGTVVEYFGFSLEEIQDAVDALKTNLTKEFKLEWKDDSEADHSLIIRIVVEFDKITLKDDYTERHTGAEVWNNTIYEEAKETAEESHTHKITVVSDHGKVEFVETALMGEEVLLKITPDKGYAVDKITTDDEDTEVVDNKFVMPDKDIKITVTYKQVATDTTVDENPGTYDGIYTYITLLVASLGVLTVATKKVLKNN